MSVTLSEKKESSRTLLLIIHCSKSKIINDVAPVLWEFVGDRRKLTILKIPEPFGNEIPYSEWGARLGAIKTKYAQALNLDPQKDKADLKVL